MDQNITVVGAREHNLKNISVQIPKHKLVVITGPSGSGKSSLALDVLYTEGKRRYMESLSSYARQFLGIAKKPDFDRIEGLCPAVAIEQKTVGSNPRSTVGTITEIYDYFRILFARIGIVHCPQCDRVIAGHEPNEIAQMIASEYKNQMVTIASPIAVQKKGEFIQELLQLFAQGFYRFSIDGKAYKFRSPEEIKDLKLKKTFKHDIDVLLDACTVSDETKFRLEEGVKKAFELSGSACKIIVGESEKIYSSEHICLACGIAAPELEPRLFSFNSPIGACKQCLGIGVTYDQANDPWQDWAAGHSYALYMNKGIMTCSACLGRRLNKYALSVKIQNKNIFDLSELSVQDCLHFMQTVDLNEIEQEISSGLLKEIISRLTFLQNVGLSYLTLNRTARTLSGGEGQRIRLAKQVGCALSGVLYVLDEPSIGLHQRDNDRLIETLKSLREQGNSVLVVEHDIDTIKVADYVIDMGPAAGVHGGRVTAAATPQELAKNPHSLTGQYLNGTLQIKVPAKRRQPKSWLTLKHASKNNLKDVTVQFPLGVMCGVSGVSGSGKSSLIFQELVPALYREIDGSGKSSVGSDLQGIEALKNVVTIDQSPIGRTSRSNPATYVGVFDAIRKFFASVPESKLRGYDVGRFSFNVQAGRCFECKGEGSITVSMHFLPDVVMQCKVCKGSRYNQQTLEITYKGKNIADVLDMTALEAAEFFSAHKLLAKRLELLCDVGLDYIKLGQPSTTLSGGEAQRIKLVNELAKRDSQTLYILDEPTTGLHTHDIAKLLSVLERLINKGNSMIVIEHNLDVLKTVDYIIDMGPEGGVHGGYVVAQGTPEQVIASKKGYTGKYLQEVMG